MKVLFITRKYPPQIGGMEKYSYELIKNFSGEKEIIALDKPQINLLWFLPYALFKGIFLSKKVDLVYLCDSLLAPIGLIIKIISKKPVIATAHGLDIIYENWFYKNINIRALKYLDKIIAVSHSTIKDCISRGVKKEKCVFIPNGIEIKENDINFTKKDISKFLKFDVTKRKILLTVGRLTKRKGVLWFINNVLINLDPNVIYLIAGKGSEEKNIKEIIRKKRMLNQVFLLGEISDERRKLTYHTADIFIMSNIKTKGDKEGFGIVALEASLAGLPVIASRLEGISDAIFDKNNGFLVNSGDKDAYIKIISKLLDNEENRKKIGLEFKKYTEENYNWDKIISLYQNEFRKVLNNC